MPIWQSNLLENEWNKETLDQNDYVTDPTDSQTMEPPL